MKGLSKLSNSIYTGLVGAVIAAVVAAVLKKVWTKATGDAPPDPRDPDASVRDALVWAGVSGVGVAVARMITARITAALEPAEEPAPTS